MCCIRMSIGNYDEVLSHSTPEICCFESCQTSLFDDWYLLLGKFEFFEHPNTALSTATWYCHRPAVMQDVKFFSTVSLFA